MEGKPTKIKVGDRVHRIQPVPRKLNFGGRSLAIAQVLHRKGGLIIGEGDTGKTTYVQMLYEAAKAHDRREPILVKLRWRPRLEIPDVPEGEVQTIIWDGLDEYPECAREIVDRTDDLDPERYHVWVTSRPGSHASIVAGSLLLEDVYHLAPFTEDDIHEIARSVGLDGDEFLARVRGTHLASFVAKPGGAVILMQLFANGKLGNQSRTDLMETIMRDFARETRDGDAEAEPKLSYSEREIVEATGWIATCLVLTGKDAVWTGPKSACPANDFCLDDLPIREYSTALFNAAIGLRLFEPLTQTRYRLAYSEMPPFLAGRWLAKNLPIEKFGQLCQRLSINDPLLAALAWASMFDTAFGKPFVLRHPESFLGSWKLITETGYTNFANAILKTGSSETADYSLLSGFDAFAKYLHRAISSRKHKYTAQVRDLVAHLYHHCQPIDPEDQDDPVVGADEAGDQQECVDVPTEREAAELLTQRYPYEDDVCKLMRAERERGFPYLSLRQYFDDVVFKGQKPNARLIRPEIVGLAIAHDCERYLPTVLARLPPLKLPESDDCDLEDDEDFITYSEDEACQTTFEDMFGELPCEAIFDADEYTDDLPDDEKEVPGFDAGVRSVCDALLAAAEENARVFADIDGFLAPEVKLQMLNALLSSPDKRYNALEDKISGYSTMTQHHRNARAKAPSSPIGRAVSMKPPASLSPAEIDALAHPAPKPVEAVVVSVTPEVRQELGAATAAAVKNRGGRPKKSQRDGNYLSQPEIAKMFGPPCNAGTVANWERFVRTEGKSGATPPSANIYGKWVSYTPDLRESYTGENVTILAAIITAYKSIHTVKTRIGSEKTTRAKSDETLYRMQHPDGMVRTKNRGS